MIKIEHIDIQGWEPAIRGMRNPMNSWEKSDSKFFDEEDHEWLYTEYHDINNNGDYVSTCEWPVNEKVVIGPNDLDLMKRLVAGGSVHAKFRRMIVVYADITAPLYWWKEFDTYKVGTVANSCSTMHKIHAKEFELEDFSTEHLIFGGTNEPYISRHKGYFIHPFGLIEYTIALLNECRAKYIETHDKKYWWQMIQLLPSSYNQKRTVMLNYEVLSHIYRDRKNHKLDEWREFCGWIEKLPYAKELIIGE